MRKSKAPRRPPREPRAKLDVAGSTPVARSQENTAPRLG